MKLEIIAVVAAEAIGKAAAAPRQLRRLQLLLALKPLAAVAEAETAAGPKDRTTIIGSQNWDCAPAMPVVFINLQTKTIFLKSTNLQINIL